MKNGMKTKLMIWGTVLASVAMIGTFAAQETLPVEAATTSSYTKATISFGTTIQDNYGRNVTTSTFTSSSASSYVTTSGFTSKQKVSYVVSNCQEQGAGYYDSYALQIGKLSYWPKGTTSGSLTITLSNAKYISASIYADTYYKKTFDWSTFKNKVTHYVEIPFAINGVQYSNDGSWISNSDGTVSYGSVPQYDVYYCTNPQTSLTITVPGTTEQYDMIYITKIVFHLSK
jgi:hypothetical protein